MNILRYLYHKVTQKFKKADFQILCNFKRLMPWSHGQDNFEKEADMNRRSFLKKVGLLCLIPFFGLAKENQMGKLDDFDTTNAKITVYERWIKGVPENIKLQDYPGTKVLMQYSYSGDYWWIQRSR